MNPMITFIDEKGRSNTYDGNTLLIFIDETGEESLNDESYPIFGFGGCMVMVSDYPELVSLWKKVESTFSKEALPLHAADLIPKEMTQQNFNALKDFFGNKKFGRFASVITSSSVYEIDEEIIHVAAVSTYPRVTNIAKWMPFTQIVMIFEESQRTKIKASEYFSRYSFNEDGKDIPVERFFMTKKENEAGLTIADFISHTAGSSVQSGLNGGQGKNRKDFEIIFKNMGDKLCQFMEIQQVRRSV